MKFEYEDSMVKMIDDEIANAKKRGRRVTNIVMTKPEFEELCDERGKSGEKKKYKGHTIIITEG